MDWTALAALLAAGLAAGALSGLFGIGGGVLMTPVLHYGFGLPWIDAVALSLLAIAVQSPVGVWRHARRGAVDWRLGALLAAGTAAGVAAGDLLIFRSPVPLLKTLFAAVMVFAAYRLVAGAPRPRTDRPAAPFPVVLGALGGLASRLLGIGGGLVTVPALMLAGIQAHRAVASSLVAVFVAAALATAANLARGLDAVPGLLLAAGAAAGAVAGVRLAHALPEKPLRRGFAILLVLAALYVAATSGVL